ncbi:MgtC/SapB family protein [Bradyrhizobium genosp. L]|uniref:MgtC/SapB family protein n=1 Tax=Bradyrhizobium genosp. L TaxID=83637 RepID=UPI0018A324A2|nr:MgtC/SapB family protein [Bradyrhizobium genosp. L]QPF87481.1 MgtC/SapB family protein [Bradyrhizobium genosp. L]
MSDWSEIILRLGAATLAGGAIGLDRDLRGKPIGLKTLGLVSLSTAMVVLLALQTVEPGKFTDAASRVIQGVLTGIGFLGAGVIVRRGDRFHVHGLTSAACAFLAACVGVVCGAGHWPIVITALVLAFLLLTFGKRAETWLHRTLGGKNDPSPPGEADQSSDAGPHQPGR